MTTSSDDCGPAFGYLLVDEDERHGFTGGLLVVCERGRPLEFHCTEPVQPSRAQQILFGPTLRSYVCGEQIGGALVAKTKLPMTALFVRDEDSAPAGCGADAPSVLLEEGAVISISDPSIASAVDRLATVVDIEEPFARVREAIREAQRLGVGGPTRAAA